LDVDKPSRLRPLRPTQKNVSGPKKKRGSGERALYEEGGFQLVPCLTGPPRGSAGGNFAAQGPVYLSEGRDYAKYPQSLM